MSNFEENLRMQDALGASTCDMAMTDPKAEQHGQDWTPRDGEGFFWIQRDWSEGHDDVARFYYKKDRDRVLAALGLR